MNARLNDRIDTLVNYNKYKRINVKAGNTVLKKISRYPSSSSNAIRATIDNPPYKCLGVYTNDGLRLRNTGNYIYTMKSLADSLFEGGDEVNARSWATCRSLGDVVISVKDCDYDVITLNFDGTYQCVVGEKCVIKLNNVATKVLSINDPLSSVTQETMLSYIEDLYSDLLDFIDCDLLKVAKDSNEQEESPSIKRGQNLTFVVNEDADLEKAHKRIEEELKPGTLFEIVYMPDTEELNHYGKPFVGNAGNNIVYYFVNNSEKLGDMSIYREPTAFCCSKMNHTELFISGSLGIGFFQNSFGILRY